MSILLAAVAGLIIGLVVKTSSMNSVSKLTQKMIALMACCSAFLCNTAATRASTLPVWVEAVMAPGTTLTAPTTLGLLRIEAVSQAERRYEWNGWYLTQMLFERPRDQRWYGSLGLYANLEDAPERNGVHRVFLLEDQMNCHSINSCLKGPWSSGVIWSPTGLLVSGSWNAARFEVTIGVRQMCINGKKPENLRGANTRIRLLDKFGKVAQSLPCRAVGPEGYIDTWPDRGLR